MIPSPAGLAPLSVVIPVRNEAAGLPSLLADLATAPQLVREVLVQQQTQMVQTVQILNLEH